MGRRHPRGGHQAELRLRLVRAMNALLGSGRAGLGALIRRFRLAGRARSRTADMDFGHSLKLPKEKDPL